MIKKKLFLITATVFFIQISNAQTDSTGYFGQTPPGESAVVFAPGLISNRDVYTIAFSPEGNELCLVWPPNLYYSKLIGSTWTKIDTAYFEKGPVDGSVNFSPDGQSLTFAKPNPVAGNPNNSDIYFCTRVDTSWSQPMPFPNVINSTDREAGQAMTMNKTLYFSSGRIHATGADVFRAKCINGEYTSAVYVPNLSTQYDEDGVWVSSDESYAIVESWQDANKKDLYISFRKPDSTWTKLKNMGTKINSASQEVAGKVSPDRKYLFFASNRSGAAKIYWIRVDNIIKNLKKTVFAPIVSKQIHAINIKTDSVISYAIPKNTFTCEYGTDSLKYTATLNNGSALPSWLIFNSDTRTLSGTPTKAETDTIKITATNMDTVSASCTFKVTVSSQTSVDQFKEKGFEIFPNPTTGQFTISFGSSPIQKALIEIYDLQGKQVLSRTFRNTAKATIDLSGLPNRMYVVKVIADGVNYEDKILKE